jgi:hypothetical protein
VRLGSKDGSGEIGGERGTYEIEIEDLVIPSTGYPNNFPFLFVSHHIPENCVPVECLKACPE